MKSPKVNILTCLVFVNIISVANNTLLGVITIFRHGDRNPVLTFPNDPYKDYYGTSETGSLLLTDIGKQRMMTLGKWFKNYYNHFIPQQYNDTFIQIISDETDRTMMSAISFTLGLYPSAQSKPIPILLTDTIISNQEACPVFKQTHEDYLSSNLSIIIRKNQNFFEYLSNHTGIRINSLKKVQLLQDVLYIQSTLNLSHPLWAKKAYNEIMHLGSIYVLSYSLQDDLRKLIAGPFWNKLLNNFDSILKGRDDAKKFLVFSGHDFNIVSILKSINKYFVPFRPPFSSALVFELHQVNQRNFIRILLKIDNDYNYYRVDCGFDCNYEIFKKAIKGMTMTDYEYLEKCIKTSDDL